MGTIREHDYTFVTNNRADFLDLHGQESLHAGVIILVPNIRPIQQRQLFSAALKHIGARDLTNTVIAVKYSASTLSAPNILCRRQMSEKSEAKLASHDGIISGRF